MQAPLPEKRLEDISNAVIDNLNASCAECDITTDIIDKQFFFCNPETPTYVTYSARLEGTSETDSGSLISLIEEWVRNGTSIIMAGVEMTVNSECSVAISYLTEKDCFPTTESTTVNTNMVYTITGGVVAVVFIIALTIVAVAIAVAVIVKSRAKVSNNYNEE